PGAFVELAAADRDVRTGRQPPRNNALAARTAATTRRDRRKSWPAVASPRCGRPWLIRPSTAAGERCPSPAATRWIADRWTRSDRHSHTATSEGCRPRAWPPPHKAPHARQTSARRKTLGERRRATAQLAKHRDIARGAPRANLQLDR